MFHQHQKGIFAQLESSHTRFLLQEEESRDICAFCAFLKAGTADPNSQAALGIEIHENAQER